MYTQRMVTEDESNERLNNNILSDLAVIEQKQKQKEAQTNDIKNMIRQSEIERTNEMNREIIKARENSCPFCKEFSLLRYATNESFPNPPAAVTFSDKALLLETFGNNPALQMHIQESHENVLSALREKQKIVQDHCARIDKKNWVLSLLKNNTPEELLHAAGTIGQDPKVILCQTIQEIFDAEAEYSFLKSERKRYEEEIKKDPYYKLRGGWR